MNHPDDETVTFVAYVHRAMLGNVFPSIRAITAQVTQDTRIVRVYLDRKATPEELELLSEAETELLADYSDNKISVRPLLLPMPTMVPRDDSIWVYARYEPEHEG